MYSRIIMMVAMGHYNGTIQGHWTQSRLIPSIVVVVLAPVVNDDVVSPACDVLALAMLEVVTVTVLFSARDNKAPFK